MRVYLLLIPMLLRGGVADHVEVLAAERLFTGWMEGQMTFRSLPGVVVGVVHDQELVWWKGFGNANVAAKAPVTASTKFRMASHSKLFTATAIMQLRDQGKLRLDDPVVKYLPWFKPKPAAEDDPPITIEDLLTHGSGLAREAGSHWSDDHFPDAAGLRDAVLTRSVYSPGVRWKYSNLAFSIAAQIVEAVSGEGFAAYQKRHILGPLGMKDSSFDEDLQDIAVGYGRRMPDGSRAVMHFVDAKAMAGATGLTSTLADMARFVSLQFRRGSPVLSTGALREMHRVRLMENNWLRGNAIGFAVNRDKDRVYVGHGGSYFGYKTHTLMQIDDKVGVIVLTNGDDSVPADIATKLMQGVGAAVAKAGAAKADAKWDPAWARFAGLYRNRFAETQIVEMDRALVAIDPTAASFDSPQKLVPMGDGRFRLDGATGGTAVGEVVRFVEEKGRVVRVFIGDSFSERVAVQ